MKLSLTIAGAVLFALSAPSAAQNSSLPESAASGGTIRGTFFALSVADAKAVANWYRQHLGFRIFLERAIPERQIVAVLLERNGSIIEIVQRADTRPAPVRDGKRSAVSTYGIFKIGLAVADLEELHDRLAASDVHFDFHIVQPDGHPLRTFAIRDPEGNIVQFIG